MAAADVIAGRGPQLHARRLSNVFIKTNELPTAWIGFLNRKMRRSRDEGSTTHAIARSTRRACPNHFQNGFDRNHPRNHRQHYRHFSRFSGFIYLSNMTVRDPRGISNLDLLRVTLNV